MGSDNNLSVQSFAEPLQAVFSALRALHWFHWTNHWQSSGNGAYARHLLFERLYTGVVDEIDGLAEKMVATFGNEAVEPLGSISQATLWLEKWTEGPDVLARALEAEQDVQGVLQGAYDSIKESGGMTLGLDDFIMATANAHETNVYLLQQHFGDDRTASERRMAKALETVWVVEDPTEDSELIDIAWATSDMSTFENVVRGAHPAWHKSNPTIHDNESSARADAVERFSRLYDGKDNIPAEVKLKSSIEKMGGKHLDPDGADSAESHFFDAPRQREVREFAQSGATSNIPGVGSSATKTYDNDGTTVRAEARDEQKAPPTPSEIIRDVPGGQEFSSLNRYVVETAQPTDAGVPTGHDTVSKHEKLITLHASLRREWQF